MAPLAGTPVISSAILRIAGILLVTAVATASVDSRASDSTSGTSWVPSSQLIAKIESTIKLPAGSDAVSTYTRYYIGITEEDGRHIVRAVYVAGGSTIVTVSDESKLPQILDGGCGVIDLEYDVEERRVILAACHGDA